MVYYCYLKYNALVSDFFIYNKFANVFQSPVTISLLMTYLKTPYERNNKIALHVFSSSSAISLFDDVGCVLPSKILVKSCCRNKACNLMCRRQKLLWPSKFSTAIFVITILQNKETSSYTNSWQNNFRILTK